VQCSEILITFVTWKLLPLGEAFAEAVAVPPVDTVAWLFFPMLEALVPGAAPALFPTDALAPGFVDMVLLFIGCPVTWISSPTCVRSWSLSPCRV
jgi:hypothetical protein